MPSTTTTTLGGPRCGNGIPEAGEECDDGARNSDTLPNACRTSCRRAHCGDGVLDTVELCDDGVNGTPNDCCDDTCRPRRLRQPCGDDGESACDHADSCDSNGVCRPNFAEDGTECPADELDCTEDVCDGGGRCVHRPGNKGFQCRVKGAQDECDAGDVCDGASAECPLTHANAGCQATTPDEVRKAIPVTCEVQADTVQGGKSSCDAAGFEVTGGATPRAVPPAGLTLGRRVTVALKPGQKKLPKPDAAGVKRKVLKLKLNSRGKQLLKSQGSLRVLVRVTVRHGGLVRQLETLVRVVGGG